jgi:hypothetical protein
VRLKWNAYKYINARDVYCMTIVKMVVSDFEADSTRKSVSVFTSATRSMQDTFICLNFETHKIELNLTSSTQYVV